MEKQLPDLSQLDIIYFSSIDWNYTWQRPQQLASRLSRYGHLLYVGPMGLRPIGMRDLGRIVRRTVSELTRRSILPNEQLTIHTPLLYVPFPGSRWAARVNGLNLRRQVVDWMKLLNIQRPIVWIGSPSYAILDAIHGLDVSLIAYDCMDNFPLFHKDPYHIIDAEQQITTRAHVIFATATELYDRMKLSNTNTFRLPNGADSEHFSPTASVRLDPPQALSKIHKPILGYTGEIAQWFDFDLVRDLAMRHPEWSIVLIGLVHSDDFFMISRLPNVHYLGRKTYEELPAYLRQFDACILPFKINALTSAVNPVKLYEYLAAGKPVISTPLREVLPFRDVVEIATAPEFSQAVSRALASNDETKVRRRIEIAKQNTWGHRVDEIIQVFRGSS